MTVVHVCRPVGRLVREIAEKTTGEPPDAITLGAFVFLFTRPTGEDLARLMRHERVHVLQAARFAPRWARWLPETARVWLGTPRFLQSYLDSYRQVGYDNLFEREARAAE